MRRFLAVAALVLASALPALAVDDALSQAANQAFLANNAKQPGVHVTANGLQFKILQNGFGKRPTPTDTVKVYYTGTLINGKIFDGTSPGLPATFKLNGGLIQGWLQAMLSMREGDHWQVVIPSNLAYGSRGSPDGTIAPDQTVVFDLQLVSTTPAPKKGTPECARDPQCAKEQAKDQEQ
jgi:FKBP-type peptidyl-prolyl cis-trans isomerase